MEAYRGSTGEFFAAMAVTVPSVKAVCVLLQVAVHYPNGRQQLVTYRQAFTGECLRACVLQQACVLTEQGHV